MLQTAIGYVRLARDGTERGAPLGSRMHPAFRGNLPILYRLAGLHARMKRRARRLSTDALRAECLERWGVWKAGKPRPGEPSEFPSRATVHRWRRWVGLAPDEIDQLILEAAGKERVTRTPPTVGVNLRDALLSENLRRGYPSKARK